MFKGKHDININESIFEIVQIYIIISKWPFIILKK